MAIVFHQMRESSKFISPFFHHPLRSTMFRICAVKTGFRIKLKYIKWHLSQWREKGKNKQIKVWKKKRNGISWLIATDSTRNDKEMMTQADTVTDIVVNIFVQRWNCWEREEGKRTATMPRIYVQKDREWKERKS